MYTLKDMVCRTKKRQRKLYFVVLAIGSTSLPLSAKTSIERQSPLSICIVSTWKENNALLPDENIQCKFLFHAQETFPLPELSVPAGKWKVSLPSNSTNASPQGMSKLVVNSRTRQGA
jgi:hypothetical protein